MLIHAPHQIGIWRGILPCEHGQRLTRTNASIHKGYIALAIALHRGREHRAGRPDGERLALKLDVSAAKRHAQQCRHGHLRHLTACHDGHADVARAQVERRDCRTPGTRMADNALHQRGAKHSLALADKQCLRQPV